MMKLLSVAALSFVAAADVPVFSSNDDYDEINLNIRLLQSNVTGAPVNVTAAPGEKLVYTVSGSMSSTYTTDKTATALCSDIEAPTAAALKASTSSDTATIDTCAAPAAASRARKLSTDVAIDQAYSLTFATATAASTATSTITGAGFAAAFATTLNAELAKGDSGLTATVSSFTAPTTAATTVTTAAPAATPAAPAPSPSSDASMVKANVALAAVAALFASLF
jgi:hypothetical protein